MFIMFIKLHMFLFCCYLPYIRKKKKKKKKKIVRYGGWQHSSNTVNIGNTQTIWTNRMSTETSGGILKGDRWSYLELGELQRDSRRQELERLNKEISRWYNVLTLSLVFGADSPEARKQLEKLYERREIQMITEFPEDSGPRKKANLMAVMQHLRSSIRDLKILLETSTPQAKNLLVHKEIEKLERSAEKVQMGLQELVL